MNYNFGNHVISYNTRDSINAFTQYLINMYEIQVPIDNIDSIVDLLGGKVIEEHSLSSYSDGFVCKNGNSFDIMVSSYQSGTRRTFTIAHELGHLFLHMGYRVDPTLWDSQDEKKYYRYGRSEEESEANEFAASLLMPKEEYYDILTKNTENGIVDINRIANYFKVSYNAALNRGKWLGYIEW